MSIWWEKLERNFYLHLKCQVIDEFRWLYFFGRNPYLLSHMKYVRCQDLSAIIFRNIEDSPTYNFETVDQRLY